MPTIIDLQALGDSPGTVDVVADALQQGDYIALPLETTYVTAILPEWRRHVSPHLERFQEDRAVLAFRDFSSVDDLAGPISGAPLRLLRRCWPGPTIAEFRGHEGDSRLAHLPAVLRGRLFGPGGVRTTVPKQEFMRLLLRRLRDR